MCDSPPTGCAWWTHVARTSRIKWSRRGIFIVAWCNSWKLCALAARPFQSQQSGALTRMWRCFQVQHSQKERFSTWLESSPSNQKSWLKSSHWLESRYHWLLLCWGLSVQFFRWLAQATQHCDCNKWLPTYRWLQSNVNLQSCSNLYLQSQNWIESCEEFQKKIINTNPNLLKQKNDNIQTINMLKCHKIEIQVYVYLWSF